MRVQTVQIGERLVHEQDGRFVPDALASATRCAARLPESWCGQASSKPSSPTWRSTASTRPLRARNKPRVSRPSVTFCRTVRRREQRRVLENQDAGGIRYADLLLVHEDAARVRAFQSGDQAQYGGFAAAAGAQQRDEFAGSNGEVDPIEHGERLAMQLKLMEALPAGSTLLAKRPLLPSQQPLLPSNRSRSRNSSVIRVLHINAITNSAAYMFGYAAQPCAQVRYQPRPALTPHHLIHDQHRKWPCQAHEPHEHRRHRGQYRNAKTRKTGRARAFLRRRRTRRDLATPDRSTR